ncbi:hypothetical protein, partial [Raoultella ornithinolytica]|uniref:hypothetical protein n=1 Tax=Raoultella ornithinolytica TaxID=54291 RepID=UPI00197F359C
PVSVVGSEMCIRDMALHGCDLLVQRLHREMRLTIFFYPRSWRLLSFLFIYAIPMKNSHENMANS